jgi:transposase
MTENTSERFAGVDVSKHTLDIHIEGQGTIMHVVYDDAGIKTACKCLLDAAPTLVVMEATGGLETRIASELAAQGLPVAVANPRQVRDFAKAMGQLAKSLSVNK